MISQLKLDSGENVDRMVKKYPGKVFLKDCLEGTCATGRQAFRTRCCDSSQALAEAPGPDEYDFGSTGTRVQPVIEAERFKYKVSLLTNDSSTHFITGFKLHLYFLGSRVSLDEKYAKPYA